MMSQVAQSLRFLHLNKIVHLDLKPENILFMKNYSIKLIDFGESFHPLVAYGGNFYLILDSPPAYTYPYGCP
jgi:serine/threonine protein kinase